MIGRIYDRFLVSIRNISYSSDQQKRGSFVILYDTILLLFLLKSDHYIQPSHIKSTEQSYL